ncbi:GNAT family N-acetyltransferase [Cognatishimia maritima]|uniref:Predicted N-acyltransferase, GNAT family n=1 Tax=Cognatishimia maritima TaxID=870908 RepID=A0A1M5K9Y0_9RHOB|nr:GNAT family N-acetyltransferase [Cognatishimia maritima]SHG49646.1 Predicted N-acyltransferase, GNAT family [Cognatishimia maritima]
MKFEIQSITAQETLPLRQKALWPGHLIEQSMVDGDETALHFGGYLDRKLVCVASLFHEPPGIRLRKFATDPAFQGQGFGSQMLRQLLHEAQATGAKTFWFDARESALPFYQRNGYTPDGERFFKADIPYRRIVRALT